MALPALTSLALYACDTGFHRHVHYVEGDYFNLDGLWRTDVTITSDQPGEDVTSEHVGLELTISQHGPAVLFGWVVGVAYPDLVRFDSTYEGTFNGRGDLSQDWYSVYVDGETHGNATRLEVSLYEFVTIYVGDAVVDEWRSSYRFHDMARVTRVESP